MNLNNPNFVGDNTDKTFGNQEFERTKVKQSTDNFCAANHFLCVINDISLEYV